MTNKPSVINKLFNNTEVAFSLKKDSELERAYFLFKMIANEPLVRIGTAMTNFAIKAHLPVEGLIRATVFDHFCGGVSEEDCVSVIDTMYTKKVCSVLDYSVEGKEDEAQFDAAFQMTVKLLDFVNEKDAIPFSDAADDLVTEMMRKYNTEKAIVFNTLQMYRWDRLDYLQQLHKEAEEKGFYVGMKLVRGAYMEKENDRANANDYSSPICESKVATDRNFDAGVIYMIENLGRLSLFAGTHNEDSSYLVMQLMQQNSVPTNSDNVWFGQLYGMSDHISYNLSEAGYNVAKYLPFGPVKDVMPYLIRRAEENTSVAGQTTRELNLLKEERKRRKL